MECTLRERLKSTRAGTKRFVICRLRYTGLIAGAALAVLTGCADSNRVLGRMPGPLFRTGAKPPQAEAPPQPIYTPPPVEPRITRNARIVIDPGHGGHDSGTRGRGASPLPEKSLNLLIAQELAQQLRYRGAAVSMTRTDDRYLELDDRGNRGNAGNLFVSIHIDASRSNPGASGATVYICRGASGESERVAGQVSAALKNAGFECRGVKRANYRVLVVCDRPSILVECGFLSNNHDARMLNSPEYRSRLAAAIADGIAGYFGW